MRVWGSRAAVLGCLGVLLVAIAGCGGELGSDPEEPVTIGGMEMSAADVRDLTKRTMGVEDLADLDVARPGSEVPVDEGKLRGDVRHFRITAEPTRWEYREGQSVAAWAYNGSVPGPVLRAKEGEDVQVTFRNELTVPTTVHWHGVDVPWRQDGVPGVTQQAVEPGEEFIYRFVAEPSGTRWYHTHGSDPGDEASQLDMGLAGPLVIEPRRPVIAQVDRTLVLDEWLIAEGGLNGGMLEGHGAHVAEPNVFTINGRAAPDIDDIVVDEGDVVRLRFINASTTSYHPMHMHGHQFRIVALDGNPVERPVTRNVVLLAPGETADVEFVANSPGVWMLHCHDLHHAGAGMHMLVRYRGYEPVGEGHGPGDGHSHEHAATGDDEAGDDEAGH